MPCTDCCVASVLTQALLKDAHEVEVKKKKEEDKIERQLAVRREDTATEVGILVSSLVHFL